MNNQTKIMFYVCVTVICAIFIYTIERALFPEWSPTQSSPVIQITGFIVCIFMIKDFQMKPLKCFKVKSGKGKNTILHCISIIVIVTLGAILIRTIMNTMSPEVAARPFIGLYLEYNHRYIYPLIIVVQQFFAKAVVLDSFINEFNDTKFWKINLFTSLLFASLHLGYKPWIMAGATVLLLVTNLLYRKDENIYSSIVLHFMCGFVAPMFGLLKYV